MSLGEICVVIIVAIFVMKPEDIPVIIDKFKCAKKYFTQVKTEVLNYICKELNIKDDELSTDISEINLYVKKIVSLGSSYDGDYSLEDVKAKYKTIIKQRVEQEKP